MLTRVLRTVRLDSIDQRSQVGVALRRLREEMTADLGGEGEVTADQRILIEEAAKARIIAQAVGDYILRQESLVRDGGELLPAVMQHNARSRISEGCSNGWALSGRRASATSRASWRRAHERGPLQA